MKTIYLILGAFTFLTASLGQAYNIDFTSFGNSKFDNPWRPTQDAPFVISAYTNIPVDDSFVPLQQDEKTPGLIWTSNQGLGVDGEGGGNAIAAKPKNNGPQEIDFIFDSAVDLDRTLLEIGLRIQNNEVGFNNRNPIAFVSSDGGLTFETITQDKIFQGFTSSSQSEGVLSVNALYSLGYITSNRPDFIIFRSIDTVLDSGGDYWIHTLQTSPVPIPEPKTFFLISSFILIMGAFRLSSSHPPSN